jgi:hypothetical protein
VAQYASLEIPVDFSVLKQIFALRGTLLWQFLKMLIFSGRLSADNHLPGGPAQAGFADWEKRADFRRFYR